MNERMKRAVGQRETKSKEKEKKKKEV